MRKPCYSKKIFVAPVLAAAMLLGGCGGGVQFEGAIFEKMGLGDKPQQAEAKMPERAPLVLPPKRQLPQPGPRQVVSNPQAWPQDPDIILKKQAEDKKTAAKRRCAEGKWDKTASISEFEKISDPILRCKGLGTDKELSDELRGDGSPDTNIQRPDDGITTPKEAPTPWRNQITQTKPTQ